MVVVAGNSAITGGTLSLTVMVCAVDDVFPHASANVHVRVITYELAHEPATVESTPSTVITSPQLSVAESETIAGTSAVQATVTFSGAVGATGATLSLIVMVCDIETELLQASVNVQVRVVTNELGQAPGAVVSTPVAEISPEQLSVAVRVIFCGTSVAQIPVTAAGAWGAIGAVVS